MKTAGDDLAPGVRRLRPDDHFMILSETEASPMHVGALLLFDTTDRAPGDFATAMRRQLAERLPATPLSCRLVSAPDGYDSDVWANIRAVDLDGHIGVMNDRLAIAALHERVADLSMVRLALNSAPFKAYAFSNIEGGRAALYFKMHHAVADGIGFQSVLQILSDDHPVVHDRSAEPTLPDAQTWRALADERFAQLAPASLAHRSRREEALAALKDFNENPTTRRALTPTLKLSGPTSPRRAFATQSLPLSEFRATATALGGTINDLFLAIAATAIRETLIALDDLPDTPIVANSARSYRKPEHGLFGNRIVALHPHLATSVADPLERLRAIQTQMANEFSRTQWDEAMLDQPERPYGSRDRRAKFAQRIAGGGRLLPGNVTLSNVPGPSDALTYAGMPLLGNFPVAIIGSGRFLNITSRRNAGRLDLGIMTDPTKLPHPADVAQSLSNAFVRYKSLALHG